MEPGKSIRSNSLDLRSASLWALGIIATLVLAYRIFLLNPNELSWDVFGYYLYLPSTFIHHDPLLKDISWIHELMAERPISGTLYQLGTGPEGQPVYFFLLGMALLYMPFFLLGHGLAAITGQPMDGFSLPYQYAIAVGFVAYTLIALIHLRWVLRSFFSDRLTAFLLVILTLGTNWFHFVTMKNLETANAIFMLVTVIVWNTLKWHRTEKRRHLVRVAFSLALVTLVKPSEVLVGLIPLLWGVYDLDSLKAKWGMLWRLRAQVLFAAGIGLIVVLPQMIYWMIAVGRPLYDSYVNPGVGLDLWSPHLLDAFFSYRKGWLLYTPVMVFALIGFAFLYKRQRSLFPAILIWFLASTWIIVSWTEWWYGASYSVRPMITSYAVLGLPLGYCIQAISSRGALLRMALHAAIVLLIALNLFQTWQHHHNVLDPYRTTKEFYWAIFGRTHVPDGADALKSPERSFTNDNVFGDRSGYRRTIIARFGFENMGEEHAGRTAWDSLAKSMVYRMDGEAPYSPTIRAPYGAVTDAEYAWIYASVRLFIPHDFDGEMPCLVFSVDRSEGAYAYKSNCPDPASFQRGQWTTVEFHQMLPPIRSADDGLTCYVWCRSQSAILIDDLSLDIYTPKRTSVVTHKFVD